MLIRSPNRARWASENADARRSELICSDISDEIFSLVRARQIVCEAAGSDERLG